MTETRCHKHSLKDTIECSIIGWEDKPPLLTKREIPLDYVPDPEDAPESLRGRGAYVNLSQAILAYLHRVAGNGQWVWREDMATDLRITHEKHFGDSLALLVARSQLERHQGRGSRTCFRLLKGPTPARETNLLKARVLRTLGNEWVSCGGLAERLGVHSSRIAENANELVREGHAEVKREASYSEKKQGNGNEYRASRKEMVRRLAAKG
jgi:hypothetical protein